MPDIKCRYLLCDWHCADSGTCTAPEVEVEEGGRCATFSYNVAGTVIDQLILDGKFVEAVRIRFYAAKRNSLQEAKEYCEDRRTALKKSKTT